MCRGNPRYGKLFGPVSISNDYTRVSKDLIVRFMRGEEEGGGFGVVCDAEASLLMIQDSGTSVRAWRVLMRFRRGWRIWSRMGKGVPILLKQYLKLNATLLAFNVDPSFGNCLDALVLLDLERTPDRMLARYMGKEAMKRFRAETG